MKTTSLSFVIIIGLLFLLSCENNPILGNDTADLEPSMSQGIPTTEMTFVSWNPEVIQKMRRLDKTGTQTRNIDDRTGGQVGGIQTFGNTVDIPYGALNEEDLGSLKAKISVVVNCIDGIEQCGAGVDFLPSQKFEKDVKITLSWEYLDYAGGELDFLAYYSEDDGETWYEVDVAEIDYDNKTLTVYVDHFTRFAWAL